MCTSLAPACALACAEAGRPVAAWDINGEGAEATAKEAAAQFGVPAIARQLDVTESASFADAIADARAALGPIGGLVHAAGVGGATPVPFIDEPTWDAVVDVNLRAEALLVKELLPALREVGAGAAIVGIASVEALSGNGMLPAYCASKAGMLGLTRSMAHAFAAEGIRVNAVCPGAIDTPMLWQNPNIKSGLEQIQQADVGRPEDVASAIAFLGSDDARFVQGTAFRVDGGNVVHF